jgi:hypothetical protein
MSVLEQFAPVFTARTWDYVPVVVAGGILTPGRRLVTTALRTMGLAHVAWFQNYHRVLNRAVWSSLTLSRILLGLLLVAFVPTGPSGARVPRSTRTVWRILVQHGRIVRVPRPVHEPVERPAPMTAWQLDYKDASTVPPEPEGKQGHVVEVLNTLDVGTSVLLAAQVGEDFTAETSVRAVAEVVQMQGLPDAVTFDRDPLSWLRYTSLLRRELGSYANGDNLADNALAALDWSVRSLLTAAGGIHHDRRPRRLGHTPCDLLALGTPPPRPGRTAVPRP